LSSSISQKGPGVSGLLTALKGASVTVGIHAAEGAATAKEPPERGVRRKDRAFFAEAQKRIVASRGEKEVTVIDKAEGAEFGIGQPPRPFLTGWFDANETELRVALEKIVTAGVQKHQPVEQALRRFGAFCVGQIQQGIADGIPPELSEARKAEKAARGLPKDTPLIFTGQLRSSIRSVVEAA
jgi:hypothetical protein